MAKHKEIILKAATEKLLIVYMETPIRLSVDSSAETFWDRRVCVDIFKVQEEEEEEKEAALNTRSGKLLQE